MRHCPSCGYENAFGALICARCAIPLVGPSPDPDGTALWKTPPAPVPEASPQQGPGDDVRLLGENTVLLYIGTTREAVSLEVVRQAALGRYTATGRFQPRVDLTPHSTFAETVSRMHGIIRRTEDGLEFEDLASTNGTWLNGVQLKPYTPSPLKPGDCLQLGQLQIEIYFR